MTWRWERRAARKASEKQRLPKDGKDQARIYRDVVQKRVRKIQARRRKMTCPDCGSELIPEGNCNYCGACGYSSCGGGLSCYHPSELRSEKHLVDYTSRLESFLEEAKEAEREPLDMS